MMVQSQNQLIAVETAALSPRSVDSDDGLFGGSGTTLIAAETCGRQARLLEYDPSYCDTIVARWQTYTGKRATLDTDGRSFEEVATERFVSAAYSEA